MYPEIPENSVERATLRLAKLAAVPRAEDLDFALLQAGKNADALVELPWKSGVSPTYVLTLCVADGEDGPRWTLLRGDTVDAAVIWSFDSDDTSLIESLIQAECGGHSPVSQSLPLVNGNLGIKSSESRLPANGSSIASSAPHSSSIALSSASQPPLLPEPESIDFESISAFDAFSRDEESGLHKKEALLSALLAEYRRYEANGGGFSILLVDVAVNFGAPVDQSLPPRAQQECSRRMLGQLRKCDYLGLYSKMIYICLLPGLKGNEAIEFARRFAGELSTGQPLQPGLDQSQIRYYAGVASIPDTCDSPEVLLAAAGAALEQAKERRVPVALFPSAAR